MWEVLGSWPVVVAVFLLGVVALVVAGQSSRRTLAAAAVLSVATVGAGLGMTVPLTLDGATCNLRATPHGVNHSEFGAYAVEELRASGLDVRRYECRDALRMRYLVTGAGYLAVTLGTATLLGSRRSRVRRGLSARVVPYSHRRRSRWWLRQ